MTIKDLKCGDLIELYGNSDFRRILEDEFDICAADNTFVCNEDDEWNDFNFVTKIWRENKKGDYILIFDKMKEETKNNNESKENIPDTKDSQDTTVKNSKNLTFDMIKDIIFEYKLSYNPYIWVLYELYWGNGTIEGILYSVNKKGEFKIVGKNMYKSWNEFMKEKDYEYADYVFLLKQDNNWYWMDTCKLLLLQPLCDEK